MPVVRLTSTNVHTLAAVDGKRTDYADALLPGLVLRVSPNGVRSWSVLFSRGHGRAGRRTVRVTLGKLDRIPLQQAKEDARKILEAGAAPASSGLTVEALVNRALADLELRPTTRHEWERLAKKELIPGLGARPAAELERGDVRAWLREIGRRSHVTSNRALTVLRRAYSWGIAEELVKTSPCVGLVKLYEEQASERVLNADELRRLLGALARLRDSWPAYADATLLLLLTAVREAAVLGLRRDELQSLDGREALWILPAERSKSGRTHHVPLSPAAVAVVRRRLAAVDEAFGEERKMQHLFPVGGRRAGEDRPMTWSSNWVEQLRDQMRPVGEDCTPGPFDARWTIHGLRHTAGTHLVEDLGTPLHVASLLLGHTAPGPRVTGIYVRAELLPERRAALERWAAWLEQLATPVRRGKILAHRPRRRA